MRVLTNSWLNRSNLLKLCFWGKGCKTIAHFENISTWFKLSGLACPQVQEAQLPLTDLGDALCHAQSAVHKSMKRPSISKWPSMSRTSQLLLACYSIDCIWILFSSLQPILNHCCDSTISAEYMTACDLQFSSFNNTVKITSYHVHFPIYEYR